MESKNTFSILFYIRRERVNNNGEAPIYLRITINGEYAPMNTGRTINTDLWDSSKGYVTSKATVSDVINNHLDLIRKKVYEAHKQLLDDNQIITSKAIRNVVSSRYNKPYSLIKVAEFHNSQMKVLIGKSTTKNNYKTFKTSLNYLKQFIPYCRSTESSMSEAWNRGLLYFDSNVEVYDNDKRRGFSVRCIKD